MIQKIKSTIKTIGLIAAIFILPLLGHRLHKHYLYDVKGMSVVKLMGEYSGGTGFQVKYKGKQYTLTNFHVCASADSDDELKSYDYFGNMRHLKVIARYTKNDLCVLEPINYLPAIRLAGDYYMHEQVYLVGHPRLEALTMQTASLVAKYYITLMMPCHKFSYENKFGLYMNPKQYCERRFESLHANVISYGGNSGSPVLDDFGNAIGVLFAGQHNAVTASYIVPLEYIKDFLSNL